MRGCWSLLPGLEVREEISPLLFFFASFPFFGAFLFAWLYSHVLFASWLLPFGLHMTVVGKVRRGQPQNAKCDCNWDMVRSVGKYDSGGRGGVRVGKDEDKTGKNNCANSRSFPMSPWEAPSLPYALAVTSLTRWAGARSTE